MAYIGRQLARGENKLFDDISSSFNGSTTTFNLTVSSVATATATPYQLFVSLGGVMQKPNTDFTTAGNQITFTTAPAAGLSCWIMMQGDTIDNAAIADSSVTPSKISGTNFAFSGDLRLKDADGSHYVGFASPTTVAANKVWTLPAADGSASQYLQTNGSGVLSWSTVSVGGATGIDFNDNVKARWGTGNDLEIFHDGSHSYLANSTGNLYINAPNYIQLGVSNGGEKYITATENGTVELYHNNVKKIETSAAGISITGALTVSTDATITGDLTVSGTTTTINTQTLDVEDKNVVIGKVSSPSDTTADGGGWTLKGASDKTFNWVNATDAWTSSEHIHLGDNKKLLVGDGSDLSLYHDGSHSNVENTTGNLHLRSNANCYIQLGDGSGGWENALRAYPGGAVELYHNDAKKIETTSGGINVTGAIQVNGAALDTAPTLTAVADGAIAANKAVALTSAGKFKQIVEIKTAISQPTSKSGLSAATIESGTYRDCAVAFNPDTGSVSGSISAPNGLNLVTYRGGTTLWCEVCTSSGNSMSTNTMSKVAVTSNGVTNPPYNECIYMGDNYWLVAFRRSGGNPISARTVQFNGSGLTMGTEQWIESGGHDGTTIGLCRVSNTRAVAFFNNNNTLYYSILDFSGSGSSRTFSRTAKASLDTAHLTTAKPKAIVTNSGHIVVVYSRNYLNGQGRAVAGTISGAAGSGSISWGTNVPIATTANNVGIAYDSTNDVIGIKIKDASPSGSGAISAVHCAHNTSNNALTFSNYTASGGDQEQSDNEADMFCTDIGYFICTYRNSNRQQIRGWTFSGTTPQWKNEYNCTNQTIEYPRCTYDSVTDCFVGVAANNSQNIVGGINNLHDVSSSGTAGSFLGFSAGAYSDGNTATVNTFGNTTTQSGLTTGSLHYVKLDGTLSTSSSNTVCSCGTALSTTSLFIRDPA